MDDLDELGAVTLAWPNTPGKRSAKSTAPFLKFLRYFQSCGYFLMDLCREPGNHLPPEKRKMARIKGEHRLQRYLHDVRPLAIIVVIKGIADHVERALKAAGSRSYPTVCFTVSSPRTRKRIYCRTLWQLPTNEKEIFIDDDRRSKAN